MTLNELKLYVQDSIRTPILEADPVYVNIKNNGIENIINVKLREIGYTINNLTPTSEAYLILLVKKEIYLRLATETAPEYDYEAEFSKLLKSQRFDHYMMLVAQTDADIQQGMFDEVQSGEVIIASKDYSRRNYAYANKQDVSLVVSSITQTTANLDWNKYDVSNGTFSYYYVGYKTAPIYDVYAAPMLDFEGITGFQSDDIQRVKYRLTGLTPGTLYYVVVIFYSTNGNMDIVQSTFTTTS